jgi:hypothetical protein
LDKQLAVPLPQLHEGYFLRAGEMRVLPAEMLTIEFYRYYPKLELGMSLKSILFTIILNSIALSSCGQAPINLPEEFVESAMPKIGSKEWYLLNNSQNAFRVKVVNGKIQIEKAFEINTCELKISKGKLIGIDKGEWGGTLSFLPKGLNHKQIEIKSGNIKFIFEFKNKIYFIEGLSHLHSSSGAIYELGQNDENFVFKKIIDFDDAPEAFAVYEDKILIATHENFYVVENFAKKLIVKDTFWASLYPNSIAVLDEQNVFIGLRGGIAKLDLTTQKLKFYIKTKL